MYKTNSKRKTLNGCCQMCIKTLKMSQKRGKPQGAPPWKLGERKWSLEKGIISVSILLLYLSILSTIAFKRIDI